MTDPGKPEAGEVIEWIDGADTYWLARLSETTTSNATAADLERAGWCRVAGNRDAYLAMVNERDIAESKLTAASLLASELRERAERAERNHAHAEKVNETYRAALEQVGGEREALKARVAELELELEGCVTVDSAHAMADEMVASERAGRERAIADARRMHYLGNVIRARSQVEQDELTRLMRKYPPLAEVTPAPPPEAQGGKREQAAHAFNLISGDCNKCGQSWRRATMVCEPPPASPPASDADGERTLLGADTRCGIRVSGDKWCQLETGHAGACGHSPPPAALGPVELMIAALRKLYGSHKDDMTPVTIGDIGVMVNALELTRMQKGER